LKVDLAANDGLKRTLTIEIPAETVNDRIERGLNKIRQEVTLKGYRKGKAPMDIIRSNYTDKVKAEIAEEMIQSSYGEAVREKELKVATPPTVTDLDFKDDGAFTFTAELEVLPELEKVISDGLEVKTVKAEVEDKEVDEYLEYIRRQLAEFRPLTRPATETDIVVVDLKKLHDPKLALKSDEINDAEIDLGGAMTVKEFKEQVPGMAIGDEKEITVKYDKDYSDQNFAGAEIKYLVKVKEVKERILPEINDALAKQTGKAETALELKLALRKEIETHKADELKKNHRSQIIDQMCKKNEIDVPEGIIAGYLESVVKEAKESGQEVNEEQIRTSYRPIGENTFRWNMIMQKLAEDEKIEVSPTDTENLIKRFADNYNATPEQAREALTKSGRIADIRDSILEEKVLDLLMSRAKMVETKD